MSSSIPFANDFPSGKGVLIRLSATDWDGVMVGPPGAFETRPFSEAKLDDLSADGSGS